MNTSPTTHETIRRWYRGDGGGFLSALAAAWQVADSGNRARIETTWADHFTSWANHANKDLLPPLPEDKQTQVGFDTASAAIKAGHAKPRQLWLLLAAQSDRDGYALRPFPWEGPGEYQHVWYDDERGSVLVRLPDHLHLPRLPEGDAR